MFFPISHAHINPIYLVVVGFVIGILGGFFGVGGSFIAGPALRLMGVDWNYAVGTDLAHIVGKSIVAAKQHRALGNVDLKLGFFMAFGTIAGAECGGRAEKRCDRAEADHRAGWSRERSQKKTAPHSALSRGIFNG